MALASKSLHSFQTYYSSQKLKVGIILFLAVACPLFLLMPAYATTLTVSNNADSGAGSLRQAISSANSGDTIDFASNLADSTITLTSGELVIDKVLTIASTVPITVSGNSSSRVISTSLPLTLTGFTIADGSTPDDGAGVFAGDSLVVDKMTFTGNINSNSQSANGGAIYAVGELQVDHSSFLLNEARDSGGAIQANSTLMVNHSTFLDNLAVIVAGGAINHSAGDGQIINSVFARNRVVDGLPIFTLNLESPGHVDVIHNTIVGADSGFSMAIGVTRGSATISNTIIMSYTTGIDDGEGTVVEDFNLFNNVSLERSSGTPAGVNDRTDSTGNNNPDFVDMAADDYHLLATSNAIDSGMSAGVTDDHDEFLRDAAPDVGAFESPFGAAEISVANTSIAEGNIGTTLLSFPLTLSTVKGITVTVAYTISDGTATNGVDYSGALTGIASFVPGATSTTIDVDVSGDLLVEPDESLNLQLWSPQFATLTTTQATGTINNDDVAIISIADASVVEGNSGTSNLVFTVTIDGPVASSLTVFYSSADDTATSVDNDYSSTSGQVDFAAGETSQLITVTVNGDTKIEADETLTMTLSGEFPSDVILARSGQSSIGTILNDDSPAPTPTHTSTHTPTPTNTPTFTPTPTNTPTNTPQPTATPLPNLHLTLVSDPPAGEEVAVGDRISYTLVLSNSGGIANNLQLTVLLSSNVSLIPSSITPPTSTVALKVKSMHINTAMDTLLTWSLASLDTNQSFQITFAVTVDQSQPVLAEAQGGVIGEPPLTADANHLGKPTSDDEIAEPAAAGKLFLPLVTR